MALVDLLLFFVLLGLIYRKSCRSAIASFRLISRLAKAIDGVAAPGLSGLPSIGLIVWQGLLRLPFTGGLITGGIM